MTWVKLTEGVNNRGVDQVLFKSTEGGPLE